MWFITAISIEERGAGKPPKYNTRTFGYYLDRITAVTAIVSNRGCMHESLYQYIVLEYIPEGIFTTSKNMEWYKWIDDEWTYIESAPEDLKILTNWAIG